VEVVRQVIGPDQTTRSYQRELIKTLGRSMDVHVRGETLRNVHLFKDMYNPFLDIRLQDIPMVYVYQDEKIGLDIPSILSDHVIHTCGKTHTVYDSDGDMVLIVLETDDILDGVLDDSLHVYVPDDISTSLDQWRSDWSIINARQYITRTSIMQNTRNMMTQMKKEGDLVWSGLRDRIAKKTGF
jgi:hypothetical protein